MRVRAGFVWHLGCRKKWSTKTTKELCGGLLQRNFRLMGNEMGCSSASESEDSSTRECDFILMIWLCKHLWTQKQCWPRNTRTFTENRNEIFWEETINASMCWKIILLFMYKKQKHWKTEAHELERIPLLPIRCALLIRLVVQYTRTRRKLFAPR